MARGAISEHARRSQSLQIPRLIAKLCSRGDASERAASVASSRLHRTEEAADRRRLQVVSIEPETRDIPEYVETTWASLRSVSHRTDGRTDGDETVHESTERELDVSRGRVADGSRWEREVRRFCGSSAADIMIRYSLTETGEERNFQLPPRAVLKCNIRRRRRK